MTEGSAEKPVAKKSTKKKYVILLLLAIAGATIYELAYVRYQYYDVMMEALNLDNTQMGMLMTAYGITAMICYFPGGWLADKLSCKKLMVFSLLVTGLLGFYFATFPNYTMSLLTHIIWGIVNTLTFWAAMIKATRMIGDLQEQGRMYGLLEGGRGLMPLLYGVPIVMIFSAAGANVHAFSIVIVCYSIMSIVGGLLILLFFKEDKDTVSSDPDAKTSVSLKDIGVVIKMPEMWCLAILIFSSYCLYTSQSYVTPYLTDLVGVTVTLAAVIGLVRTYLIPVFAGPLGGIIADKVGSSSKVLVGAFVVAAVSVLAFRLLPASPSVMTLVTIIMILLATGVFVTRGIYFSTISETGRVPTRYTGTAIGFASFIGFMPEAFIYTLIGNWLDNNPGAAGYQIMFNFMFMMALVGMAASLLLVFLIKKHRAAYAAQLENDEKAESDPVA